MKEFAKAYFKVLSQPLPGGTKGKNDQSHQDSKCPGQELTQNSINKKQVSRTRNQSISYFDFC